MNLALELTLSAELVGILSLTTVVSDIQVHRYLRARGTFAKMNVRGHR